jgi:hypothetical protein
VHILPGTFDAIIEISLPAALRALECGIMKRKLWDAPSSCELSNLLGRGPERCQLKTNQAIWSSNSQHAMQAPYDDFI